MILLWHGSRDRRAAIGFEQLVRDCQKQLAPQEVWGCQLECTEVALERQLSEVVSRTASTRAIVLPVFVGEGVHVRVDIPQAIAHFQHEHPQVEIAVLPPLGHAGVLLDVLRDRCGAYPETDAWILWGHGSRRPSMAQGLAATRAQLAAQFINTPVANAFWTQSPTWCEAIQTYVEQGYANIAILPCFWFAGGLTERLSAEVRAWQSQHDDLHVAIADVLMPHPLWVADIARQVRSHSSLFGKPAA